MLLWCNYLILFCRIYLHPSRYRGSTCHVTTYSSLNVTTSVYALLSVDEQAVFRLTIIFSGCLVHFLMTRQIDMGDRGGESKVEKMRVIVFRKELSFGRKNFSLISGLSFTKSTHKFVCPSTKPFLKTKYFFNMEKSIKGNFLKDLLFGIAKLDSDVKVKLSLLYVVQ
ncbi:hypothetical protein MKX01_002375 [Papaver californicum]|nr:hypothetical protein MKX01_002375 [Papaver californicum]